MTAVAVTIQVDGDSAHLTSPTVRSNKRQLGVHASLLGLAALSWYICGTSTNYPFLSPRIARACASGLLWGVNLTYVSFMALKFLEIVRAGEEIEETFSQDAGHYESEHVVAIVGDVCINLIGIAFLCFTVLSVPQFAVVDGLISEA